MPFLFFFLPFPPSPPFLPPRLPRVGSSSRGGLRPPPLPPLAARWVVFSVGTCASGARRLADWGCSIWMRPPWPGRPPYNHRPVCCPGCCAHPDAGPGCGDVPRTGPAGKADAPCAAVPENGPCCRTCVQQRPGRPAPASGHGSAPAGLPVPGPAAGSVPPRAAGPVPPQAAAGSGEYAALRRAHRLLRQSSVGVLIGQLLGTTACGFVLILILHTVVGAARLPRGAVLPARRPPVWSLRGSLMDVSSLFMHFTICGAGHVHRASCAF